MTVSYFHSHPTHWPSSSHLWITKTILCNTTFTHFQLWWHRFG